MWADEQSPSSTLPNEHRESSASTSQKKELALLISKIVLLCGLCLGIYSYVRSTFIRSSLKSMQILFPYRFLIFRPSFTANGFCIFYVRLCGFVVFEMKCAFTLRKCFLCTSFIVSLTIKHISIKTAVFERTEYMNAYAFHACLFEIN